MYFVFDIGGTKTRIALSSDLQNLDRFEVFNTPKLFDEGIKLLVDKAKEMADREKILGVSGSIAGVLSEDKSQIFKSWNMPGWEGQPLKKKLEQNFQASVILENDALAEALGEANFGAGRGKDIVAYITYGTGIGGAKIISGQPDKNLFGFEPGHQVVTLEGRDLESLISPRAIFEKTGKTPEKINDNNFWRGIEGIFSIGLYNSILHWSPEILILNGSMINKRPGVDINNLRQIIEAKSLFPKSPEIALSELGDRAGLYGSISLLKIKII